MATRRRLLIVPVRRGARHRRAEPNFYSEGWVEFPAEKAPRKARSRCFSSAFRTSFSAMAYDSSPLSLRASLKRGHGGRHGLLGHKGFVHYQGGPLILCSCGIKSSQVKSRITVRDTWSRRQARAMRPVRRAGWVLGCKLRPCSKKLRGMGVRVQARRILCCGGFPVLVSPA